MEIDIPTLDFTVSLHMFGTLNNDQMININGTICDNIYLKDSLKEKQKKFYNVCKKILYGNCKSNNKHIHRLVYDLVTSGYQVDLFNIISQIYIEVSNEIREQLSNKILLNEFTIKDLIETYDKYILRTKNLQHIIWYFDKHVRYIDKDNISCSYIDMISLYVFYYSIINNKYDFKDDKLYLYDIINIILSDVDTDFKDVIKLNDIYNGTNNLKKQLGDNSATLFNIEIDKNFLSVLGDNKQFIKNITMFIDKNIKLYIEESAKDVKKILLSNLLDIMVICKNLKNKDIFYTYYKYLLRIRLLRNNTDIEIETQLINYISNESANNELVTLKYMVNDVKESTDIANIYKGNEYSINTKVEKYKNINMNVDKDILNINILRKNVWDNVDITNYDYNIPHSLLPYIGLYKLIYNIKYSTRELNFDLNNSTGVCEIELSGKKYMFQLTLSQLLVLLKFNEKDHWSGKELKEQLNLPYPYLTTILNSLLKADVLHRDHGSSNDLNLKFSINESFSYDKGNKLSLVKFIEKNKSPISQIELYKLIMDKIKYKSLSLTSISKELSDETGKTINTTLVNTILKKLIHDNYIIKNEDKYEFKPKDSSNSDYESSIEDDEDTEYSYEEDKLSTTDAESAEEDIEDDDYSV